MTRSTTAGRGRTDLSQAIYEYAPGSEVVAGGMVWTSRGLYRLTGRELDRRQYVVCDRCGLIQEGHDDLAATCPGCANAIGATPRDYVVPEFGFVAARRVLRTGPRPPKRAWNGATHVLRFADAVEERHLSLPGGDVAASFGPRGQLLAISEGPGRAGYLLCDWCGWAAPAMASARPPREHEHLIKGDACKGRLSRTSLGHRYETDILRVDISLGAVAPDDATWWSVLFALMEGACQHLEIARDDVDGTLAARGLAGRSLVLFDTVPGGAGNVLRIAAALHEAVLAGLARVRDCECGPETACYACLRGYRNQRHHDELSLDPWTDLVVDLD